MGVWLQARGRQYGMRDGRGHDAPMKQVKADEPTWFKNLSASAFEHDKDVFVVLQPPPVSTEAPKVEAAAKPRAKARSRKRS